MRAIKIGRLVLAVAGVLAAGGLAGAQGPGGPGMGQVWVQHGDEPGPVVIQRRPVMEGMFGLGGGQLWNNPDIVKQLNLTDVQRKAMDGIMQDHRLKLIDLQANLERAEVELGPLMKADTPDRAAIVAQIDKVVAARASLEKANSLFLLDLRMQLTPAQWKQLQTMRQNHMDREERGEHGQQRGAWGHDGQRPDMGGPGNQFFFHRQIPPAPPAPSAAPQEAPAPAPAPAPSGTGDVQ